MAERVNHIYRLIDSIHALVARRMTCHALYLAVKHHQSFLGNGWLHIGRFAHQCEVNGWKHRKHSLNAILATHLFLCRSQKHKVVRLRHGGQRPKCRHQRHHGSPVVVCSQAINGIIFLSGSERRMLPTLCHLHRVDMRIEQNGGLIGAEILALAPHIVGIPLRAKPKLGHRLFHHICHSLFLSAERWHCHNGFQQVDCVVIYFVDVVHYRYLTIFD